MSAVLENLAMFRPMCRRDVDEVARIEKEIHPFPWTSGNFLDSLDAGYSCWVYDFGGSAAGYAVLMLAGEEAHLLNLSVAGIWQRKGMGRKLLLHLIKLAREYGANTMFLEVRPSNAAACGLYDSMGFSEIALRRNYYPAAKGREDAVLMGLPL